MNIGGGLEYWYASQFAFRAGYFSEHFTKGNRQYFTLGAGLRYNIFSLDLSYLVANAQERGIPLRQVEGTITVITSADWILERVDGDFRMTLDSGASSEEQGRADAEAIASIKERMKLCPVSRNLPASVVKHITLSLIA